MSETMCAQISPKDAAKFEAPETFEVDSPSVACDGGPAGHPKVYLQIGEEGFIDCPYCDRRFVLKAGAGAH